MTQTQHVLTVTPFFPPTKGGISNHVFSVTKNLSEIGNTVSLITPKPNLNESQHYQHFKNVYEINSFYLPGWPYPTLRSVSIPKDFGSKIKSIIRDGNFDIVHVHGHHYPFSWMAVKWAKKFEIPSVLTLHGMYALNPNVVGGKTMFERFFNNYFFKKIFANINAVIGLTGQITDYAKIFTNDSSKYYTIPNGVDVMLYQENLKRKYEYRKNYKIGNNSIVILFRGRFEHVKGILEFAKAAKKILLNEKVEIVIVGGGSLENPMKDIISGEDRIHLFGWQPEDKIQELYIASDIFVIPSRFEALPIAIMEAMNAGLHIVYSPVGGVPDILEKYPRKTVIQEISSTKLEIVLTKVISQYNQKNISESLSYARDFDWVNIARDISKVYVESASKITP